MYSNNRYKRQPFKVPREDKETKPLSLNVSFDSSLHTQDSPDFYFDELSASFESSNNEIDISKRIQSNSFITNKNKEYQEMNGSISSRLRNTLTCKEDKISQNEKRYGAIQRNWNLLASISNEMNSIAPSFTEIKRETNQNSSDTQQHNNSSKIPILKKGDSQVSLIGEENDISKQRRMTGKLPSLSSSISLSSRTSTRNNSRTSTPFKQQEAAFNQQVITDTCEDATDINNRNEEVTSMIKNKNPINNNNNKRGIQTSYKIKHIRPVARNNLSAPSRSNNKQRNEHTPINEEELKKTIAYLDALIIHKLNRLQLN